MKSKNPTKIHSRRGNPEEIEPSLLKNPGIQYLLLSGGVLLTLALYHWFFRPSTLEEKIQVGSDRGREFKVENLPALSLDGQLILNPKIDEGFKKVSATNPYQQKQLLTLRKYESVRFVGDKERELWLNKIRARNDSPVGSALKEEINRLSQGGSTVALFRIESLLQTPPSSKVDKEVHLYAYQVLAEEYRTRTMKKEAALAMKRYYSLLQEILPDVSDLDRKGMEEATEQFNSLSGQQ